jgi:hypothetical protein
VATPEGQFLLGYAEYAEAVMRSLGLKGDLPRDVQQSFGLSLQLLDLESAEFQYLKRGVLWESGGTQNAVAGEFGVLALGGRAGATTRDTLAVVEKCVISNIGAAIATFSVGVDWASTATFAGGLSRTSYPRDDRAALVATSAFATGTDSDVAQLAGSSHYVVSLAIGQVWEIQGPWVISNKPNAAGLPSLFLINCGLVNNAFRAGVMWRERQMHDTET